MVLTAPSVGTTEETNQMCLNGLAGMIPAGARETAAPTPAATLIERLGLEAKSGAEVDELYSHSFEENEAGALMRDERLIARETTVTAF